MCQSIAENRGNCLQGSSNSYRIIYQTVTESPHLWPHAMDIIVKKKEHRKLNVLLKVSKSARYTTTLYLHIFTLEHYYNYFTLLYIT